MDRPRDDAEHAQSENQGNPKRVSKGKTVAMLGAGQAENYREDQPTEQIIEDCGGDHRHSEITTINIEIHKDLGDDRQG